MDGTNATQNNADSARQITLTDFLLARIAEDEAAAETSGPWLRGPDAYDDDTLWASAAPGWQFPIPFLTPRDVGRHFDHIARHDPARVLAECEAKRRIMEEHRVVGFDIDYEDAGEGCINCGFSMDSGPYCDTLKFLALPYANHPDYREEWKP